MAQSVSPDPSGDNFAAFPHILWYIPWGGGKKEHRRVYLKSIKMGSLPEML